MTVRHEWADGAWIGIYSSTKGYFFYCHPCYLVSHTLPSETEAIQAADFHFDAKHPRYSHMESAVFEGPWPNGK